MAYLEGHHVLLKPQIVHTFAQSQYMSTLQLSKIR